MSSSVYAAVEERSWMKAVLPHALVTLLLCGLTISANFRGEYVLLSLFWTFLTFTGPRTRRFANIAFPFLLVGILYDQVLPHFFQYRPDPHVDDLYNLEKRLFGVPTADGVLIPSEWFERHTSPWLDIPTGFGYMTYMFQSFLVAGWMFFQDEEQTAKFAWAFLLVNLIGDTSWILFPAAPPWYVAQYGLGHAHMDAIPSAAGALRFDQLLGISYFSSFYARSHNVFGAMPSLHVAYPVVVLLSVWRMPQTWMKVLCAVFLGIVAFAAVYLSHHYVIDAIMGIVTGAAAWGLAVWLRALVVKRRALAFEEKPDPTAVVAEG